MHPELEACDVIIEIPVAWGEMDAFQHVNNVAYFRYFENARIAYLDNIGASGYMKQHNIGPVLASTQCEYKAPLIYPDTVLIGAKTQDIGEDRFTHQYIIVSHQSQRVAARGQCLVVFYDFNQKAKTAIPELVRAKMEGNS